MKKLFILITLLIGLSLPLVAMAGDVADEYTQWWETKTSYDNGNVAKGTVQGGVEAVGDVLKTIKDAYDKGYFDTLPGPCKAECLSIYQTLNNAYNTVKDLDTVTWRP
jgi:hypothetical protein